ncbi:hypothetical protein CU669_12735 [Paramagnetospirillum kuznetsovii]|uniref:Uncharacterized protein n=1 Tax=Paramagnetospirillum kuznetsovii TaxID=2053833 RepID=A0A364NWX3_9PROT|nr:hypothetical protein [Paramagnetospirillum kuznetsovii]RAU21553.1 hypothetical protein CU669_12735 [Paramagnetospirillum kuznetsovii]
MDVKQAVSTAKSYVAEIFSGEGITAPTLEEIEFDESHNAWSVTVGFFRHDDKPVSAFEAMERTLRLPSRKDYKVVSISDQTGEPLSIKNRLTE